MSTKFSDNMTLSKIAIAKVFVFFISPRKSFIKIIKNINFFFHLNKLSTQLIPLNNLSHWAQLYLFYTSLY